MGEVKNILSELSLDLSAAKEKLLKAAAKKKQINVSLKEAIDTISSLRRKVRELTRERERLKARLKCFNENPQKKGIFKTSDLLKVAPEDLADKTGIFPKLITRWLEDAAKINERQFECVTWMFYD